MVVIQDREVRRRCPAGGSAIAVELPLATEMIKGMTLDQAWPRSRTRRSVEELNLPPVRDLDCSVLAAEDAIKRCAIRGLQAAAQRASDDDDRRSSTKPAAPTRSAAGSCHWQEGDSIGSGGRLPQEIAEQREKRGAPNARIRARGARAAAAPACSPTRSSGPTRSSRYRYRSSSGPSGTGRRDRRRSEDAWCSSAA